VDIDMFLVGNTEPSQDAEADLVLVS
jgi:hypothetical protein